MGAEVQAEMCGRVGIRCSDDLGKVDCMNTIHCVPSKEDSDIYRRISIEILGTKHIVSKWLSVPRTTSNFALFIYPDKPDGVFYL